MEKTYRIENHSYRGYIFNRMEGDRVVKRYEWKPIKGTIIDYKLLTESDFQELVQMGNVIERGRLVIGGTEEEKEEAKEMIDVEEYELNAMTKQEASLLLNASTKELKAKLAEITSKDALMFIAEVAIEEKLSSAPKQKEIAKALNMKVEVLFADIEY